MVSKRLNFKIGIIGCGKVGVTLGAYFIKNGRCITGFASRKYESAIKAADITGTHAYPDVSKLAQDSDMIFITTPDDQIVHVWQELKKNKLVNRIVCHASGAVSSDVFEGIKECGAFGYSVHPMYAFSSASGNMDGLSEAYFTIEGAKERIKAVREFITGMGNKVLMTDGDKKVLYHLANVLVCNLHLALLSIGDTCMQLAGVEQSSIMNALMPLILNNIQSIAKDGFVNALTGPVERNDTETVARHLCGIPPQFGAVYAGLSIILVELARKKHPERDYTKMLLQLNQYLPVTKEDKNN